MNHFAIDADNNVRAVDSGGASPEEAAFQSEAELRQITAEWPVSRLVEVWSKLPGVKPVQKFTDRKTACARIWKALTPQEATVGVPGANVAPEAARKGKKAGKSS